MERKKHNSFLQKFKDRFRNKRHPVVRVMDDSKNGRFISLEDLLKAMTDDKEHFTKDLKETQKMIERSSTAKFIDNLPEIHSVYLNGSMLGYTNIIMILKKAQEKHLEIQDSKVPQSKEAKP